MTDLHTHILPGIDDGAENVEQSIEMLKAEAEQGVTTVALTPHFYRENEDIQHFLKRREHSLELLKGAIAELPKEEQKLLPRIVTAAEVTMAPNLESNDELELLCYENTRKILVEMPFFPWDDMFIRQIYNLMNNTGLTPVFAHIDRYFRDQNKRRLNEIASFGLPVQISADAFEHFSVRGTAFKWLESGKAELIISDCHSMRSRKPNTRNALERIEKRYGAGMREELEQITDDFLEI